MSAKILFVLTNADKLGKTRQTGLWLEEFMVPYIEFKKEGYNITVSSPNGGKVPVDPMSEDSKYDEYTEVIEDTVPLDDVSYEQYDALVIPGGHGPMYDLAKNETLAEIVEYFDENDKIIGAICHGPAGLLSAKNRDNTPFVHEMSLTAFSNDEEKEMGTDVLVPFSLEDALEMLGAKYESGLPLTSHVVVDDKLVTGQNPASAKKFAQEIISLLRKEDKEMTNEENKDKFEQVKENVEDKTKEIKEGMKNFNEKFMDKAKDLSTGFGDKAREVKDGGEEIFENIKDKTSDAFNNVKDKAKDIAAGAVEAAKEFGKDLKETLSDVKDDSENALEKTGESVNESLEDDKEA